MCNVNVRFDVSFGSRRNLGLRFCILIENSHSGSMLNQSELLDIYLAMFLFISMLFMLILSDGAFIIRGSVPKSIGSVLPFLRFKDRSLFVKPSIYFGNVFI